MPHLSLVLLGSFQATLDSQPITSWKSNKIKALLAYLAVEADRPHPREALAGLLWPDYPNASALNNLRDALAAMRQAIGDRQAEPPFLIITRDTIQFNTAGDCSLDLSGLADLTGLEIAQLEQVASAYRGSFLEGFSCDSAPFEEWVLVKREQINRQMVVALCRLAEHYEERGEYERAIACARKQLELEPWDEEAHQQLMRALALNGQRSAALAQYETCCRLLTQELGVEPSRETVALYESIRDETLIAARRPRALATREEPPAQTIKGYELIEPIGQGAFGVIYRARQRHVDRQVAIKVILPEHANQPDFIRRFETEAQLVAQLEHLHIVPLYDYWREPDGAYLVMRLMKGGSLEKLLDRGLLGLSETARIMEQVGSALAAAHRQGVIHRDLKPANILLDEEGNAYLSDFGIAKASVEQAQITATGAIVGTPAYISPEQLQSQALTPQADIYSLGVLLFEMLTGQHPFKGSSTGDLIVKHLTTPLPPLREVRPDLPVELDRVIQCATAKDPVDRYADVMALVADLRRAIAPDASRAAQPIVPVPELPLVVTNPYKGLRAFQEADALDFFGREALTEQLLACLSPSPAAQRAGEGGSPAGLGRGEGAPSPVGTGEGRDGGSHFLAVVGPSGSGKSSIVKAGLLPALRKGVLSGSDQWFVVEMLPGPHPLEELEIGLLRIATRQHSGLMEQLKRDARGLVRAARLVLPSDDSTLLLLVDQFEEMFTLVEDKAEASHFMDSLCAAVSDPRSPVRVIITLRADFYDRPLAHPEFSALMSKRTQVVTPLTTDELARAIAGPAERVGAALESGLVTGIITDVKEQPGALPLLQYALTELFERREGRLLTQQAYHSIGGVMGALGRRAEEVYASLDPSGQEAARQLFLRLVTLGEGIEDTRRRVLRSELESLTSPIPNLQSPMTKVIEVFGKSRLLSFDRDLLTRGPTVEVAHEALLREWKRLREWLDASRADVRMQRLLAAAASEWAGANYEASFLLQGARLAQFEGWAAGAKLALTQEERSFLDTSLAERQKREAEEAARQRRELEAAQKLAETEKRRAEEQTRAASQLRQRAMGLAGALVIAAILAMVAFIASQRATQSAATAQAEAHTRATAEAVAKSEANVRATAEAVAKSEAIIRATAEAIAVQESEAAQQQARLAHSRELAAAAMNNLDVDPERSVLLAIQAVTISDTLEAENALHRAVQSVRVQLTLSGHTQDVMDVAFSPAERGQRLATASVDGTAKLWDVATGKELLTLVGHKAEVDCIAFSPDGKRLATASADKTAKVWDAVSGQEILTLSGHTAWVERVAFSPDGKRLATASDDKTVRVWDATTGQELLILSGHTDAVSAVAFSPDGKRLASGGYDGTVRVWDAVTGRALFTLPVNADNVDSLAFSPASPASGTGGTRLAVGVWPPAIQVWDVSTEQSPSAPVLTLLNVHRSIVWGLAFTPDGARLASGSQDGTAMVWDASTGQELFKLVGHGPIYGVSISPDGALLATGNRDRTATLWDISPNGSREILTYPLIPKLTAVGASPDRTRIAMINSDGMAQVLDLATGQELYTVTLADYTGYASFTVPIGFSPDNTRLVSSRVTTTTVWDATTGQKLVDLVGHTGQVIGLTFSRDGKRLATASWDGTARVWDISAPLNAGATTGQELLTLSGHTGEVNGVDFSPDGKRLATAGEDKTARVWDAVTGQEVLSLTGHTQYVVDIAFSPDGKRLASSSMDGTARVWDAASGQPLLILSGHTGTVSWVAFSPDGKRLATASTDGTANVWDAMTGQQLLHFADHTMQVAAAYFNSDGTRLITASWDRTVRIHALRIEELLALARSRVTRPLTTDECRKYLHVETCPPAP